MQALIIIPARYTSTRFPGKPLVEIDGKPMVQLVYERCQKVSKHVAVATDDQRIAKAVKAFGGRVVMTSPDHPSGTDRVAEAAQILSNEFDFELVINVQGDEPFIETMQLDQLIDCFKDNATDIATLVTPIKEYELLLDPNKVKAVKGVNNFALYFSRAPIPFQRDVAQTEWLKNQNYFLHIGMYAFRKKVLMQITKLEQTPLEQAEKLEQLRWLENGFKIKTAVTSHANFGIDTPEDLEMITKLKAE